VNPRDLLRLLEEVAAGQTAPETVLHRLAQWPSEPVALDGEPTWARLDHQRALRTGLPEVVFAPGKTIPQVLEICRRLAVMHGGFLVTRADQDLRTALSATFPDARAHEVARIVHLPAPSRDGDAGPAIAVVSAGTADLSVAEEAAITAEVFGHPVKRVYDVGVAGLHRVLEHTETLRTAGAVIVVAGMEGALPSVVGGMIGAPVIAVPTSIGYGASFGGIAALLGMLNSCAAGVTVVNIDNGFGAACAASRILRTLSVRAG
jgi:NCAIR mutase (PurE)-related protein